MAYRNILVHLDQTERSTERFDLALDLAGRQQARLSAFYSTSMPYLFQGREKELRDQVQEDCADRAKQSDVDFAWMPET